jgi:chromosomal replication initiation ATPase DnaA
MNCPNAYASPGIRPHIKAEFEWLCRYLNVGQGWVTQRSNRRVVVDKRKLICYALHKRGYTLLAIGSLINLHHATVLYSVRKVQEQMEIYPEYKNKVMNLIKSQTIS